MHLAKWLSQPRNGVGETAEQLVRLQENGGWMGAYRGKDHILHAQFWYLFPVGCVRDTHPD